MKETELRIGNWYSDCEGCNYQVTAQRLLNMVNFPDSPKGCQIPLTEQWLLKFGATIWKKNKHRIIWKLGKILIGSTGSVQNGVDLVFDGGSVNTSLIKHVHQLQNLYFALTGEELKTKTK